MSIDLARVPDRPRGTQIRAVAYLRKSTGHQQYSIANQLKAIIEHAERRDIEIIRLYEDAGRSGLTVRGRKAFQQLIAEVRAGAADFSIILVYDLSRWGRFQDIDEGAHLEYVCRKKGVSVEYCAEEFGNGDGLLTTIMKGVKRAMAGELSREISAKSFRGHCNLAALGFSQGGSPGFGLRRMLVDRDRNPKAMMSEGQQKGFHDDRVILVPGPPEEVAIVRMIFRLYADEGYSGIQIVRMLNRKGFQCSRKLPWSPEALYTLLHNERYAGNFVYNRTSKRLCAPQVDNNESEWIRCRGAIEPIIDWQLFERAQVKLRPPATYSDADILNHMTAIWCVKGYLTGTLLSNNPNCPDRRTLGARFGSIKQALKQVGYVETRCYKYLNLEERLTRIDRQLIAQLTSLILREGVTLRFEPETLFLRLPDSRSILTIVIPYGGCSRRKKGWWLQYLNLPTRSDLLLVARLRKSNSGVLDLHLLPFDLFTASLVNLSSEMMGGLLPYKLARANDIGRVLDQCFSGAAGGPCG